MYTLLSFGGSLVKLLGDLLPPASVLLYAATYQCKREYRGLNKQGTGKRYLRAEFFALVRYVSDR